MSKTAASSAAAVVPTDTPRLPLQGWALELARRWNGESYSVFVLHGNIFDLFPVQEGAGFAYMPLKGFLARRFFPQRGCLMFYDISEGLSFATLVMQQRFFEWLRIFDSVENTSYHQTGPPRDFLRLAPLLRRFFLRGAELREAGGTTLIIDFPEKIIPAAEESSASTDERIALVTLLKWATSPELRQIDVGIFLVTESAADLHADLLENAHVAQTRLELPETADRTRFLENQPLGPGLPLSTHSDLSAPELALRTAGLNLLRIQHLLAEAVRNGQRISAAHVAASKKRLIEEYCQNLVRFKDPRPGMTLDQVATHTAAKEKLREIAWLFRHGQTDVVERGILVPGRVGVGKSFLVDCFASECGLPVLEIGEFRSKWVGDTERQQMRILMTIRALGPVVVVVDEADAVFGGREQGSDNGVSGRVFAAFAAHIGDSSLRGRELWVAMTSRPDLLAIDMKRQGRFGLSLPLFPAQGPDDVAQLFTTLAGVKKLELAEPLLAYARETLGDWPLTGSDVEAILTRARERAVLAQRPGEAGQVRLEDLEEAVRSFIDPLDPNLLALQELAAVLSCSDKRFLPPKYREANRGALLLEFERLKLLTARR